MMEFDRKRHIFTSPSFQSVVVEAVTFFLTTPVQPLSHLTQFSGVGVYALYYTGTHSAYASIPQLVEHGTLPIYVGKAVPKGWRTGREGNAKGSLALYNRLREHAKSIDQVANLRIDDFRCRFIIFDGTEADLISTVESALIRRYRPLWNTVIDGFGIHNPGRGRTGQSPSQWDVLHPGRLWVRTLTGTAPSLDQVLQDIQTYIPPSTLP